MAHATSTPKDLASLVFEKLKNAKTNYPEINEEILNSLFDILFYTSLKTEEGQFIKVTITLIDPENPDPDPPKRIVADRWECVNFAEPIPFTVKNLVKLSKAADMWSSSLAVYYDGNDELIIWGMIDQAVHYQSFLNYETDSGPEQPGLFQSTIAGIGNIVVIFDYQLIANLKQDNLISNYIDVFRLGTINEILENNSALLKRRIRNYVNKTFPNDDWDFWKSTVENIFKSSLSRLLLRIQNYGHGGAILITNSTESNLDVKYAIDYVRLSHAITRVAQLTIANANYSNDIHTII